MLIKLFLHSPLAKMRRKNFYLTVLILWLVLFLLKTADIFTIFVKKTPTEKEFIDDSAHNGARSIDLGDNLRDERIVKTDKYVNTSHSSINVLNSQKIVQNSKLNLKPETSGEVTHIAFLKVHKAASSTVQAIIQRFGLRRNLTFVIADSSNYISSFSDIWPPLPRKENSNQGITNTNESYKHDILCNHMVFNHKKVLKLLHKDSEYIAIVREPLDQFVSAAFYYKFIWRRPYLKKLSNETFISDLIKNPNQTEATTMAESMTYNSMTYDFGLGFTTPNVAEKISKEKFKKFLKGTGETFHLVMLVEKFDESLVLMKRRLNWSLEDIIYIKANSFSSVLKKKTLKNLTAMDKEIFRKRNKLDFALYKFFKDRLEKQISQESRFKEEVRHFKNILHFVRVFCKKEKSREKAVSRQSSNSTRKERHKDVTYLKTQTLIKGDDEVSQNNIFSQNESVTVPTQKRLSGDTCEQNIKLKIVISLTIETKKLSENQKAELRDLSTFQDNDIYMATVENLSKLLPLLFYDKEKPSGIKTTLLISKSKWNEQFSVTASDCKHMAMDGIERYEVVKEMHLKHLVRRKFGDDFSVREALSYVFSFYQVKHSTMIR